MSISVLDQDIAKLREIKQKVLCGERIDEFTNYNQCIYCVNYRKRMDGRDRGTCDNCPLHIIAERKYYQKIRVNGCYMFEPYRSMIRIAHISKHDPNYDRAQLADAVQRTIDLMESNREELIALEAQVQAFKKRL